MRNPFAAFRSAEPLRRVRAWIWTMITVFVVLGLYAGMQMGTSTRWFCNEACHNVHADNARAYAEGSHSKISCMACHYPVNMDMLSLSFDRADKLFDLMPTIQNTFEKPVNHFSRLALTTPSTQCTQCHDMETGPTRTSPGIKINHEAHAKEGITCPTCHNRVAHPENFKLTLPGNKKHEDFMKMSACFRCHSNEIGSGTSTATASAATSATPDTKTSEGEYKAPGTCSTCHTPEFVLKPASHSKAGWFTLRGDSTGHSAMAREETSMTSEAATEWAEVKTEFEEKEPRPMLRLALTIAQYDESIKVDVAPVATIKSCTTCHADSFCTDCHGLQVPHATDFPRAHYREYKVADATKWCGKCHNKTNKPGMDITACEQCHHPMWNPGPDAKGNPLRWRDQHGKYVTKGTRSFTDDVKITEDCYGCHDERYCSNCHVSAQRSTRALMEVDPSLWADK